jgi:hypothetical protein
VVHERALGARGHHERKLVLREVAREAVRQAGLRGERKRERESGRGAVRREGGRTGVGRVAVSARAHALVLALSSLPLLSPFLVSLSPFARAIVFLFGYFSFRSVG